jgi:hypothetical protein
MNYKFSKLNFVHTLWSTIQTLFILVNSESSGPLTPIVKEWTGPTPDSIKLSNNAIFECTAHIKCFTEKSHFMTDKLDWTLRSMMNPGMVQTVYDSDNQTALIPTTERCSHHYLLFHPSTVNEGHTYLEQTMVNFTIQSSSQAAFILVIEGTPPFWTTQPGISIFQRTAGHFFVMDGGSGWLYYQNFWGDPDDRVRSRDYDGLIFHKMNDKWEKKRSSLRIGVRNIDTEYFSDYIRTDPKRCSDLQIHLNHMNSFICTRLSVAIAVAAAALNFTTIHFTYQFPIPPSFPLGTIRLYHYKVLRPQLNVWLINAITSLTLDSVDKSSLLYCVYTIPSDSTSFAVWFNPFSLHVWIALGLTLIFISPFMLFSDNDQHGIFPKFSLERVSNCLVSILQIIFRQSISKTSLVSLVLILVYIVLSTLYENSVTASLIVPSKVMPFDNISVALAAGYKLTVDSPASLEFLDQNAKIMEFLYQNMDALIAYNVIDVLNTSLSLGRIKSKVMIDSFTNGEPLKTMETLEAVFPKNEKVLLYLLSDVHVNNIIKMLSALKHPYHCLPTKKGLTEFVVVWLFQTGIRSQLSWYFRTFSESELYAPFQHLQAGRMSLITERFTRFATSKAIEKGNHRGNMEGKLLSLANLVPLILTCSGVITIALVLFLVERKSPDIIMTTWKLKAALRSLPATLNYRIHNMNAKVIDMFSKYVKTTKSQIFKRKRTSLKPNLISYCRRLQYGALRQLLRLK